MNYDSLKIAIPAQKKNVPNYLNAMRLLGATATAITEPCNAKDFDGLILPGGGDIHPRFYGEENVACGPIDEELDRLQFEMMDRFVKAGKPVLGICRGHQVINVYFGGSLIQDIDSELPHRWDRESDCSHAVCAVEESYLKGLYGERFTVNSSHHQAAKRIGEGLKVQLISPDGIIEAAEHESLPVLSVQWHPERMSFSFLRPDTVDGEPLLRHFLNMCLR